MSHAFSSLQGGGERPTTTCVDHVTGGLWFVEVSRSSCCFFLSNASERTEDTSPEVFWIDTQGTGTKDRSARELERSAQLFQHKLQKVELNKRVENIQNPRTRDSYIAGVERRIDFDDTEFVRSINNQRALCEQADVAFTRSDGMCLVLL